MLWVFVMWLVVTCIYLLPLFVTSREEHVVSFLHWHNKLYIHYICYAFLLIVYMHCIHTYVHTHTHTHTHTSMTIGQLRDKRFRKGMLRLLPRFHPMSSMNASLEHQIWLVSMRLPTCLALIGCRAMLTGEMPLTRRPVTMSAAVDQFQTLDTICERATPCYAISLYM